MPVAADALRDVRRRSTSRCSALFVAGAVAAGAARPRAAGGGRLGAASPAGCCAVAIVLRAVPSQLSRLTPGRLRPGSSLPLELCDLAWMTAVWALWTRRPLPTALTYYWGLTLTVQGILTPSLARRSRTRGSSCSGRSTCWWSGRRSTSRSASGSGRAGGSTASTVAVTARVGGRASTPSTWRSTSNYGYLVRKPELRLAARPARSVAGLRARLAGHPARRSGR